MIRVETSVEVCPACLGPVTGGDPECAVCRPDGDDYRTTEIVVVARGQHRPATRATWGWDGGEPGEPGGWEGETVAVTRTDTGAAVGWREIPEPTWDVIEAQLSDLAAEDDSAECADEDRADARREDGC